MSTEKLDDVDNSTRNCGIILPEGNHTFEADAIKGNTFIGHQVIVCNAF